MQSRRDVDTSHAGRHREPVWNQEFQFLVEDPSMQVISRAHWSWFMTSRPVVPPGMHAQC